MSRQIKSNIAFWGAVAFMVLIAFCTVQKEAHAGGYSHTTNNYYITEEVIQQYIEEIESSGRAASMSQALCSFDMSTFSSQGCVAAGYDFNTDAKALTAGGGKRLKSRSTNYKHLLNGMVTVEEHFKPTVGAGYNFQF